MTCKNTNEALIYLVLWINWKKKEASETLLEGLIGHGLYPDRIIRFLDRNIDMNSMLPNSTKIRLQK